MQQLRWDNELADVAQRWANQCTLKHDECGDVERFRVGQNLAYEGTTGHVNSINVKSMVRDWYEEVQNCNGSSITRYGKQVSGNGEAVIHYTQLVWAKTNKLGCGAIKYPKGRFNRFFLVCNYGPAGNFGGQSVYQTPQRKHWK